MQPRDSNETATVRVRKADRADAGSILRLIEALARYEQLTPPDAEAQSRLVRDMFSTPPRLEPFIAELASQVIGYALVFETYSSFLALPTLFLEDLFVLPDYRKMKAGKALFTEMVREADRRGCGRMEWQVLDWNTPAIQFYEGLGARQLKGWLNYRLVRPEMELLLKKHQ